MTGIGLSAPWLLAALAAVALPLVAHLARHEDRQGRGFPSLMFLRRVPFPSRARRRLRDRSLLALRLLALALLVTAFAGPHPLYDGSPVARPETDTVVLLDGSYSMGAADRFPRARALAAAALDRAAADGRAALMVFDTGARLQSGLEAGLPAAQAALNGLEPGHRATDLGQALAAAGRLLAASPAPRRRVVLVSDLQRTGLTGDPRLAPDLELEVEPVAGAVPGNLAVTAATVTGGAGEGSRLEVQVSSTGDSPASGILRLEVDGLPAGEHPLSLEPGAQQILSLPVFPPAGRPTTLGLFLTPDALVADDRRFLVLSPRRPLSVLLVRSGEAAGAYLDAALALASAPAVTVSRATQETLAAARLSTAELVILDGAAPGDPALVRALRERVAAGVGVLAIAGNDDPGDMNGLLPGLGPARETGAAGAAFDALAPGHPLAAALADGALAGVPVWRHRSVTPAADDRVLARLDSGEPVLVARDAGRGRMLVLGAALDPAWGGLVLEPVFLPWLMESLWYLAGRAPVAASHRPGATIDPRALAGAVAGGEALEAALAQGEVLRIRSPGGRERRQDPPRPVVLDAPGIHRLSAGDAPSLPLAVSVDPRESRLAALSPSQLGDRIHRSGPVAGMSPQPPRAAPDWRLAWLLLLAAAVVLLAEGLLAAWMARNGPRETPA